MLALHCVTTTCSRSGTVSLVSNSVSLTKWSYSMSRTVSWILFSSAALLFMPVMIETERLQIQDQQKAQKNQILLGTGIVLYSMSQKKLAVVGYYQYNNCKFFLGHAVVNHCILTKIATLLHSFLKPFCF